MIVRTTAATVLILASAAHAHGGHSHSGGENKVDDSAGYIRAHMANEHHIETFDLESFFKLHDLDQDGYWDRSEIEAVYGVHHDWNPKDKDLVKIKLKADQVVQRVLSLLDKDGDGRVSQLEFEAAGFDGLPNLKEFGAEGHHYDVESEFFLHHEELYHSTPETQTDEAYSHPEDEEHFANHEHIEAEEERRERAFQGLAPEDDLRAAPHDHAEPVKSEGGETKSESNDPPAPGAHDAPPPADGGAHPHKDEVVFDEGKDPHQQQEQGGQQVIRERPKMSRQDPPEKRNPTERFKDDHKGAEGAPQWGEGDAGFKRPKTPSDKMRRNVPYKVKSPLSREEKLLTGSCPAAQKYKFKRNWGDF